MIMYLHEDVNSSSSIEWPLVNLLTFVAIGFQSCPSLALVSPEAFSVSSERHRQMWGEWNCLSFETAVGGIEPLSPWLTVWRSIAWPPLPPLNLHMSVAGVSHVRWFDSTRLKTNKQSQENYLKVNSYLAQYPVLRTAQSALHFIFLADLFNQTPSQLLWQTSTLQLMHEGCSFK